MAAGVVLQAFSSGDSLARAGNLPDALPLLREEVSGGCTDSWLLYRYAWVCNRMELFQEALEPALTAWHLDPVNQWYLGEALRAMRDLELFSEMTEYADYIRGGGVCRYYLAVAERELDQEYSPSLDYFARAAGSDDDSTAADAMVWIALLTQDRAEPDTVLQLLSKAVDLMPEEDFYRCVLAGKLAEADRIESARDQLHLLRLSDQMDHSYWQAFSALSKAEGDEARRIWSLRRAMESRTDAETIRNLGWALYLAGRDRLGSGQADYSRRLLTEAAALGDTGEIYRVKADSLLGLINDFQGMVR
ncbi:MAG: hypothetical protein GF388_11400 [Candidatus Aegiribacteria sp.]|nr:hypothetical protein [Candidatus Aegiribacteria sp.]MBD3295599.1 hypothetical protein [Candidatus Fermentibacteria bacterium]